MLFNRRKNDKRIRRGNNDNNINNSTQNSGEIIEFTKEEENTNFEKINIENDNNFSLDNELSRNTPIMELNLSKNSKNKFIKQHSSFLQDTFLSQKQKRSQEEIDHDNKIFSPFVQELDFVPLPSYNTGKEVFNNLSSNNEEISFNVDNKSEEKDTTNIPLEEKNVVEEKNEIEDEVDKIVKDKISKIKEIKEHQRKCLLQENEDGLYGQSTTPKQMIREIYSYFEENGDEEKMYNDEIESENEEMVKKWENEQYRSGININKIKNDSIEHKNYNIEQYLQKLSEKLFQNKKDDNDCDEYNKVLNSLQSDIEKDKETITFIQKRKKDYKSEIEKIESNEELIKSKLEFYINQYEKIKNIIYTLIQEDEISESKEDFYISD